MIGEGGCDRQVALSHIHANHLVLALWGRVGDLKLKKDQQIQLLWGLSYQSLAAPIVAPW